MKVKGVNNKDGERIGYSFKCPGCKDRHVIHTGPDTAHPIWGFNGDVNKPTFTPSLLTRCGHFVPGHENEPCWCTFYKDSPEAAKADKAFRCYICHSIITDGRIQFLDDCTHLLAGQTIELPDLEEVKESEN
jgi:hypothetical protein